jgi:hypothetical protein
MAEIGMISFDDEEAQKLSFDDTTTALPPSMPVASQRAVKADYGLQDKSPGATEIYTGISAGNEVSLRQGGAVDESIDFINRRNAMINEIAKERGGNIDHETLTVLHDMSKADFQTNAEDIFERKFSERYHTDALKVNEQNTQSPIQKGLAEDPVETLRLADVSQHPTMIREYAKTLGENLHNEWKETGWGSATAQFLGQFLPVMSAWNLHNVLQGPNTAKSVLPGDNLGEGIDHLLRLPYAEAQKKLKAAVEAVNKVSTLDAITLVQAVQRYTTLESTVNNLVGATDVAGLGSLAGKGALKAVGKAADRISLARAARQRVTAANAPATVSDTAEAAVRDMSAEVGVTPQARVFYIPETAAKKLETVELAEQGTVQSYKTADGPVTFKPNETNTIFVTKDDAEKIRDAGRLVELNDGRIAKSKQQPGGSWSLPFESTTVPKKDIPSEGLVPVQVGNVRTFAGRKVYENVSVGKPIDSVERNLPEPIFHTDVQNGVTVQPGKAGEGMVPVSVHPDGTIRFGQTQRGEIYNVPAEAVRAMKAMRKFGKAPEYNASFNSKGEPVIWLDRKNKVFVNPSKDGEGIPVSISKDGKIEFIATGTQRDVQKAVSDHTKALGNTELKPAEVMSQIGDHDKAATIKAVQMVQTPAAETILDSLPSGMNPRNFFGKGSALSQGFTNKIVTKFTEDTDRIFRTLGRLDVARLTDEAVTVGIQETKDQLKGLYGGRVNDGWIDFLHIPPELNPNKANLDTVIGRFGDLNARPFDSRAAADLYLREVYKLSPDEAKVAQQGNSFYVQVQKFIDETTEGVRKANITPRNSTPVSMVNMLLNRLRTSEDLLADFQRNNRHVATHAPQVLNKLLREQIDSTARTLTKQQRKNVEEILRVNRDELNPALGPNKRGNFYGTDADFELAYQSRFNRLPTEAEVAHYFNYTRLSDFDYTIRNLAMYRDKGRLGLEQFSFGHVDSNGTVIRSKDFEGKELQSFPWGGQNAGILIVDSKGETRFLYKHGKDNALDTTARETVDKLIKERGFKVVQLFNPTKRELADVDFLKGKISEQIHFVVTDSSARKPIAFQQLEYRPGGHSIYLDEWYVKQPQLQVGQAGRLHYYGDNAVMNFATETEAVKYAERMDIARVMLKNNDPRLDAFLAANIPYHIDDFKKMFGKGHLDLDTPIVHSRSGASTFDTVTALKPEYREMVDATKSEYNLAGSIDSSFTADRNLVLDSVRERGNFMAIAPGRQLDPYEALNQGLGQAVRNLWMNDYKIQAVQSWIEEFGDVMKPRFKELSNNPMFFLYNPQWNEAAVDKARLAAAKASQRAIVNFVGAKSELGGQIQFLQNKMMNTVYGKLGQESAQFFGDHMLPAIKDPASYVRAVAFHSKLGLFNPIQLFVQMQSLSNVMAIAGPGHGVPGAAAAFLMRRMAHTNEPAVVNKFADMASNLGWDRGHFLEMYDTFRKTGLYEVAGEAALRDDVFDPKLFRSTIGAWLDKGTMFFNEGERAVRLTAYATAYREYKAAHLAVALGNREIGEIMSRADTLSASMTRASAASWQNGLLSIPTQFVTFNARIMEQFFSKRLTSAEKLKMFGTYAALYGVPSTVGAAVGLWPFYDDVREAAMKRGIDLSPAYMKALTEGIPSTMFSVVTGKDYNFSQRYAPGGTTMFRDLIRGDKSAMETLGGPSASIIGDIIGTSFPIARGFGQLIQGKSEQFPTRHEDWLSLVNNSSTASLATRVYTAIAYGKYVTKNNVQVGDMDNMDAVMSILGVTPQQITDTYIMAKAGKEDQQSKKAWEDAALKEFSLGMSALSREDYEGFRDYMSRFNTYMDNGDFTAEDRTRIEARAGEYKADLNEKVAEDFWRRAPYSQRDKRFEQKQNFFINKGDK